MRYDEEEELDIYGPCVLFKHMLVFRSVRRLFGTKYQARWADECKINKKNQTTVIVIACRNTQQEKTN